VDLGVTGSAGPVLERRPDQSAAALDDVTTVAATHEARVPLEIAHRLADGGALGAQHRGLLALAAEAEDHRRRLGHREHQVIARDAGCPTGRARERVSRPRLVAFQQSRQRLGLDLADEPERPRSRAGPLTSGFGSSEVIVLDPAGDTLRVRNPPLGLLQPIGRPWPAASLASDSIERLSQPSPPGEPRIRRMQMRLLVLRLVERSASRARRCRLEAPWAAARVAATASGSERRRFGMEAPGRLGLVGQCRRSTLTFRANIRSMTSAGHLPAHLHRAIASGNLLAARALAAELARPLTLDQALAVLVLIAEREPATFPRAAARFAGRLALERAVTITEHEHAAATLVDLPAAARICRARGDLRTPSHSPALPAISRRPLASARRVRAVDPPSRRFARITQPGLGRPLYRSSVTSRRSTSLRCQSSRLRPP
jgi:hypothetical protein